jgi:hypothetical protein
MPMLAIDKSRRPSQSGQKIETSYGGNTGPITRLPLTSSPRLKPGIPLVGVQRPVVAAGRDRVQRRADGIIAECTGQLAGTVDNAFYFLAE